MDSSAEPRLLHNFFQRAAQRHPRQPAIEVPPGGARSRRSMLTYAELDRRSDSVAAYLSRFVIGECVVAILLPRESMELPAAQLGVLKAGGAYTCLDPFFPDEHVRFILEDSRAVALLTDARGAERFPEQRVVFLAEALSAGRSPSHPAWLGPESLAYVIYTSGTTGRPKGVEIEHRGIANLIGSDIDRFGLTPEDRVALCSSPAYDSSVEETWLAFAAGATLVVMDDELVRLGPDLVPWLERERISVFCPSPTLLRATGCVDPEAALPHIRLLYVGGEALPEDLASRWAKGRWLENGYGPTECSVTVIRGRVRAGEPVSIGRPVRGHRAWILGEDGSAVSDGQPGELCIAGPGLARGYRQRPDLTAERFPVHPRLGRIYRTGDLARRDREGNLFYLGRLDAQVKLRGYRIELEEIEAHLTACPGVRESACALQERGGDPFLVAFVVPARTEAPPRLEELRASLQGSLPSYMVPGGFGILQKLPTTIGGKLDRAALRKLDTVDGSGGPHEKDPPRNPLEACLVAAFETVLRASVGIREDFFLDLGGDSLAAAEVISELRGDPRTASLTVRDLYEARTVVALALRMVESGDAGSTGAMSGEENGSRSLPTEAGVLTATVIQSMVLLAGLGFGASLGYAIAFVALPYLLRGFGIVLFLLALPVLGFLAGVLYAPLGLGIAVLVKKALIGMYRPLRTPVWGSFYVRNWIVQQVVRIVVPWGLLQSTVFQNIALRALGARIGRRVHIHRGVDLLRGGWDLLEIGDDATLSQDASLRLVELDRGEVVVAPVTIGAGSTVDIRGTVSGDCVVGTGSFLSALSWLAPGETARDGERWDGVPARPVGPSPPRADVRVERELSPVLHGLLLMVARFVAGFVGSLPFVGLLAGLAAWYETDAETVLTWLYASGFEGVLPFLVVLCGSVPLSLLLRALGLRLLGPVRPGVLSRWSTAYVRIGIKTAVVEGAGRWLSGSLFWPLWLRLAGMRIGRKCEISTVIDVVPETVSVGDESFFADGIYLAGPRVHRGTVTVGATRLGRNTFLGNHAVVPAGQSLPDDILVGVCTVAEDKTLRPGSSWFGHPPFELPRRTVDADRRLTHDPGLVRRLTRLFWETVRFALPVVPMMLFLGWFKGLVVLEALSSGAVFWLVTLPGATLAAAAAAGLWVLVLKWGLLGRVRPGEHPLWSCWCSRWDFLYVAWGQHARGLFSVLEGTLLLGWVLRAMGARIGRRVALGAGFAQVVDPDMLRFDDGATVCGMFQAHTFEDRILKIGRVRIRRRATVAAGAVLFYGTDIGEETRVMPHGVVMKNERLPAGRTCTGCPTKAG